ncbi:MAG: hypothetical protein R3348_03315 [Xanthomonadales bacterium]|nr:hypothetical protein [Xanthomonadales bacterium]
MNAAANKPRLVIISRDALLAVHERNGGVSPVMAMLAKLSRKGRRLLLTAPEPERWVPTRKSVDSALVSQNELIHEAREAGAELDGVYYVPRSLLTQNRNRTGALKDILSRYALKPGQALLISDSGPFLRAAQSLDIPAQEVRNGAADDLIEALQSAQ